MIKTLIGIRLRALVASLAGRSKDGTVKRPSAGKIILYAILYLYLAVVFLGMFTMMALGMASTFIPLGYDDMYLGMFTVIAFSFVFIFSIFETKAELFDCKDNELLLSMPIKPRDIVISRILTVLIYNYVETAAVMIPCIVFYAVFGGSAMGIFGAAVVTLLLPLLATALSSGVGYLVAEVARRVKKNSFVTTAVSLVFLAVYFVVYFVFLDNMDSMMGEGEQIITNPAISAIGSIASLSPLPFAIFVTLTAVASILSYKIISENYIAITTDNKGSKRAKYKAEHLTKSSPITALTKKELRRFFSSSVYMLNAGIGIIFMVILSVVAVAQRGEIQAVARELGISPDMLAPAMICALVMMTSMNMISASALSLEGKSLWVIKSMPLRGRDVILAKTLPHIIITTPPTIVCAVLLIIALGASPVYWVFFALTPVFANLLFAFFGIILNVAFPKFDYINEAQPVKQSLPVFLSMLCPAVWSLIFIAFNLFMSIIGLGIFASVITLVINAALAVGLCAVALGPSARRYDNL